MDKQSDAQAIIDAVKTFHAPVDWGFTDPQTGQVARVAALPTQTGFTLKSVKPFLDEYLERPRSLRGTAKAETLASFIDIVLQHKTLSTVIFASKSDGYGLDAVIDYHGKSDLGSGSTPSFCNHRTLYMFPQTDELAAWKGAIQWRGQGAFAQFLDSRRFELVDPMDIETVPEGSLMHDVLFRAVTRDKRGELNEQKNRVFASPGDLMQLVETLSGHSKTKFAEVKTDRFGGLRATIEKEGRIEGDEKIPTLFLVEVAAFVGGDKLTLPARIRAQVGQNGLQLAAELVGVERVLEKAFVESIKEVEAKTGCKVFRGSPEA